MIQAQKTVFDLGAEDDAMSRSEENARQNADERSFFYLTAAISVTAFLVMVSLAAVGLRGSDQYWYTAEIEQIIAGKVNESNVVFPYHAVRGLVPPPFNHHTLTHYLVLPFAKAFGAYYGWIVFNTLSTILSALALSMLVLKLRSARAAALTCIASLFVPLAFWVTTQPYLETSLALFVSVGLYLFVVPEDSVKKWLLLVAVFIAAYWCRISFLPILLLIPIGFLVTRRKFSGRVLLQTAVLLGLAGLGVLSYRSVFAPDPALTFSRYLASTIPGVSDNLHLLYAIGDLPVVPEQVLAKVLSGIKKQFLAEPMSAQIFYLPFNLLAVLSLVFIFGVARARGGSPWLNRERRAAVGILAFFGLHLVTVCLRDNELRFLMVVQPAAILGAALCGHRLLMNIPRRLFFRGAVCFLVLSLLVNAPLVLRMRSDAAHDARVAAELRGLFDGLVGADEAVIIDTKHKFFEPDLLLGYVLRPRLALFVKPSYGYSSEELKQMQDNVSAKWLYARAGSPLIHTLEGVDPSPVLEGFPAPFHERSLYRIMAVEPGAR